MTFGCLICLIYGIHWRTLSFIFCFKTSNAEVIDDLSITQDCLEWQTQKRVPAIIETHMKYDISRSRIDGHSAKMGATLRGGSFPRRLNFSDFPHAESAPNGIVCGRLYSCIFSAHFLSVSASGNVTRSVKATITPNTFAIVPWAQFLRDSYEAFWTS